MTHCTGGNAGVTLRENYHRKAYAVLRAAEALRDPGERAQMLQIANGYLALAKHVRERATGPGDDAPRDRADAH
jgi:hypothetical protein